MQVANFEYTDQSFTLKLTIVSILTFVVLTIILMSFEAIGILPGLMIPFTVAATIFWRGKKRIRKNGTVVINDSYSDFKLKEKEVKLLYADIATYHIERFSGASLIVKFKDGTKFSLMANPNFANQLQLGGALAALDKAIQAFMSANNAAIERKPSIFERRWTLPLLIAVTIAVLFAIIDSVEGGELMQTSFYTSVVFLVVLWAGWMATRRRR